MKHILFLFLFFASFAAKAQSDPSKDTIHLEITAWKYGYIAMLSPDKSSPEGQAYLRRMAKRWNGMDTAKVTTVTTLEQFVNTYQVMSAAQDGLVAEFNAELLEEVMPQAMRKPWLMQQIIMFQAELARRRQELREAGIKYLQEVKKSMELD